MLHHPPPALRTFRDTRRDWKIAIVLVVVLSLTAACGEGGTDHPTPFVPADAAHFDGIYDVRLVELDGAFDEVRVGTADGDGDRLSVTLFPPGVESLTFSGRVDGSDGTVTVRDTLGWESDFGFAFFAEATVLQVADELRITGTARPSEGGLDHGLFSAFRFEMRRRVAARSDQIAGRWRFSFAESPGTCACASTAEIHLDVPPEGEGSTIFTQEVDEQDREVGVFHAGRILVSPDGRVRLQMQYGTPTEDRCALVDFQPAPPCSLTLVGALGEHEGTGMVLLREPHFAIPFGPQREWSAVRVPGRRDSR